MYISYNIPQLISCIYIKIDQYIYIYTETSRKLKARRIKKIITIANNKYIWKLIKSPHEWRINQINHIFVTLQIAHDRLAPGYVDRSRCYVREEIENESCKYYEVYMTARNIVAVVVQGTADSEDDAKATVYGVGGYFGEGRPIAGAGAIQREKLGGEDAFEPQVDGGALIVLELPEVIAHIRRRVVQRILRREHVWCISASSRRCRRRWSVSA